MHTPLTPGPVIHQLASRLHSLPASCGPVRLIGIDGHAGSGKSTFAGRLARTLGDAPVLRLDDIASHDELFDWTDRLLTQVIAPLSRGGTAHYTPYDWHTRRFRPAVPLPPSPVVLVEGVGAGRQALRPYLAFLLWMDLPRAESWARGRSRDGEEQREFWDGWVAAERRHFSADPSRPFSDVLVRQCAQGYELRPGPAGTGETDQFLTLSDGPSPMW
ncbi:hypothetical protein STRCI_001481 [Streptomyces cinnabarinus]|uniref:Uridine kinase n=1 Tax=Streptomyces cinnabarinus TaxID=67287 RepID=A0ABY7K792_9ACTN|nr:hypothetical protein [Streptomyces cinnabarinus]WAZ20368.1 hypothetical protein STRCI_001481 [Streptomyces cinnabarinus]